MPGGLESTHPSEGVEEMERPMRGAEREHCFVTAWRKRAKIDRGVVDVGRSGWTASTASGLRSRWRFLHTVQLIWRQSGQLASMFDKDQIH